MLLLPRQQHQAAASQRAQIIKLFKCPTDHMLQPQQQHQHQQQQQHQLIVFKANEQHMWQRAHAHRLSGQSVCVCVLMIYTPKSP